jgi:mxaD protein
MVDIVERALVQVSADELWQTVGSFGSVGYWHPWIASVDCSGEQPGAVRRVEDEGGSLQVERLDEVDPSRHLIRYSMESTPLPVEHWTAELRVEAAPRDASFVTWSAHFDVRPTKDASKTVGVIRRFLRAGLDNLQRAA